MRDQITNGAWAPVAAGWLGEDIVGVRVNLRRADALVARISEDRRKYHLCAVFGIGPDREPRGLVVPLDLGHRYTEREALKSLDELAGLVRPASA